MSHYRKRLSLHLVLSAALLVSCASTSGPKESAPAFVERVNRELEALWTEVARTEWVANTYITSDTEALSALAGERKLAYERSAIEQAATYDASAESPLVARQLHLLRLSSVAPAPRDPAKRAELAQILSKLQAMYGAGQWCPGGESSADKCLDLGELSKVLSSTKDFAAQQEAWERWHSVAPAMKAPYARFVELANQGAREIGFRDLGDLWRSGYDMPPADFEAEVARLWGQLSPLYQALHCHVRAKLAERYPGKVSPSGPVPAHIFGNMWAQEWSYLYPELEPFPGKTSLDVTGALQKKGWEPVAMVKLGEKFFTDLGLLPLPSTFYERSMFTKPRDREVVCHASAWDVTMRNDVRIKMCIDVDEENLVTIHHELGHIYYYQYYFDKPVLLQSGAHDGFHEAIGDAIALSVTPEYLVRQQILDAAPNDAQGVVNVQLKLALDKVAFLPFGRLMDQWRWDVFAGKVTPAQYNDHWWKLRQDFQGISAPGPRPADAFDPGAKFHIPGNTPYIRYFLAFVLQFQFHEALCREAGHVGPLHTCSIAGNKAAGAKLAKMLALGSSVPWPQALETVTGTRQMDAGPLLQYFEPLQQWLAEQNEGRTCGW